MGKPSGRRVLLLDLDGTIADTLPHIFNAYRHAVDITITAMAEVDGTRT